MHVVIQCGNNHHRETGDPAGRPKLLAYRNAEGNPTREVLAIVPERRISRIGERDPNPFQRCRFILDPVPQLPVAGISKPVGCDARWTLMKDDGMKTVHTRRSSPVADVDDAVIIEPLGSRPSHDEVETVCATLVVHGIAFFT
jgi:hypothetical protein